MLVYYVLQYTRVVYCRKDVLADSNMFGIDLEPQRMKIGVFWSEQGTSGRSEAFVNPVVKEMYT